MYVYIQSEPTLWTVGFYDPSGQWHPDSDHETPEAAADRVRHLNGGKDTSLYAAAPDMLNALENLENDNGAIPDHAWRLVQEAISKAKSERSHINMEYLKWLRELFENEMPERYKDRAFVWLRKGLWRRYYLNNASPYHAANQILPF